MTDSSSTEVPYEVPTVPAHLHKSGRDCWAELCTEFELQDADDLRILALACQAIDRAAQAGRKLRDDGLFWTDRLGNLRPHPAIATEAKSRASAAQIIGQLQRSRLAYDRFEMAMERHAATQSPHEESRDRRGGGLRRHGGNS
jgi:P27 family predicted phage terminase small subunit